MSEHFEHDVCIVGGAGHVGFPLAVAFASRGLRVAVHDINDSANARIMAGQPPFLEPGIAEPLAAALEKGLLVARDDPAMVGRSEAVVVVVGTPVDQYLSPDPEAVPRVVGHLQDQLRPGQLVASDLHPLTEPSARVGKGVRGECADVTGRDELDPHLGAQPQAQHKLSVQ